MTDQPNMTPFNFRKILIAWSLGSILLILLLIVSLHYNLKVAFFAMLNGMNIFSYALVFVFRKNIQDGYASLRNDYDHTALAKSSVRLLYRHGVILGLSIVVLALLFGIYAMGLAIGHVDAYFHLIREDGPVENASALFWFLAAFFLLISSPRRFPWKKSGPLQSLPYLLMLLFCVVCGGEEISWGQRILGFKTPELMTAINLQNETNVHNIGSISVFSNVFFLLTLIFFLYLPYIIRKHDQLRGLMLYFFLSPPHRRAVQAYIIGLAVWLVIGIRFGTLGFHPYSFYAANYYTQMDDEIFELYALIPSLLTV
jgi:hypothetical protein